MAAGLLLAREPAAQQTNRPYELSPDAALPVIGAEQLRVQTPSPRVRVTDGDVTDLRRRTRALRNSIEETAVEGAEATRPPTTNRDHRTARTQTRAAPPSRGPGRHARTRAPGPDPDDGPVTYGRLIVITGFTNVDVMIDGQPYPYGSMQGVLLYAGEEYEVVLQEAAEDGASEPNSRAIPIRVAEGETRILMANLGGEQTGRTPARATTTRERARARVDRDNDLGDQEEIGYLGVSSSPRGIVYVDGENSGQMTPARRIELSPGRHEVRIFYESEDQFSETKNVLIREGVNTNVFFRHRPEEEENDVDESDSE